MKRLPKEEQLYRITGDRIESFLAHFNTAGDALDALLCFFREHSDTFPCEVQRLGMQVLRDLWDKKGCRYMGDRESWYLREEYRLVRLTLGVNDLRKCRYLSTSVDGEGKDVMNPVYAVSFGCRATYYFESIEGFPVETCPNKLVYQIVELKGAPMSMKLEYPRVYYVCGIFHHVDVHRDLTAFVDEMDRKYGVEYLRIVEDHS